MEEVSSSSGGSQLAVAKQRERKQRHKTRTGLLDSTTDITFYELSLPKHGRRQRDREEENDKENSCGGRRTRYQHLRKTESNRVKKEDPEELADYAKGENIGYHCSEEGEADSDSSEKTQPWEIEYRKKSIQTKLMNSKGLFTESEENDIHERAELYAVTMIPDENFYIVSETTENKLRLSNSNENTHSSGSTHFSLATRKRKRRSYNNINCYVTHHNRDDFSDNTHMLPKGTKLLKPPNKLVELVAQAIDGSPDGLLQVQQIYTVLQNKYPYFRYMDKSAINSWRSSIRHALYQKWFRKIRFKTEAINSKGCYWTINRRYSPKEWTMPGLQEEQTSLLEDSSLNLEFDLQSHESLSVVPSLLHNDNQTQSNVSGKLEDVLELAEECGISVESDEKQLVHIPSPVKDPDPVLGKWMSESWSDQEKCLPCPEFKILNAQTVTSASIVPCATASISNPHELQGCSSQTWLHCSPLLDWPHNSTEDNQWTLPTSQQSTMATYCFGYPFYSYSDEADNWVVITENK